MDYANLEPVFNTLKRLKFHEDAKSDPTPNVYQLVKLYGLEPVQKILNHIQYQFYQSFPISKKLKFCKDFSSNRSSLTTNLSSQEKSKISLVLDKSSLFSFQSITPQAIQESFTPSKDPAIPLTFILLYFFQEPLALGFSQMHTFKDLISKLLKDNFLNLTEEQSNSFQSFITLLSPTQDPIKTLQNKLLFSSYTNYFFNLLSQKQTTFSSKFHKEFFTNLFGKDNLPKSNLYNENFLLGNLLSKLYPKLHKKLNHHHFDFSIQSEQGPETIRNIQTTFKDFIESDFYTIPSFSLNQPHTTQQIVDYALNLFEGKSTFLDNQSFYIYSKMPCMILDFQLQHLAPTSIAAPGYRIGFIVQPKDVHETPLASSAFFYDDNKLLFSREANTSSTPHSYAITLFIASSLQNQHFSESDQLLNQVIHEEGGGLLEQSKSAFQQQQKTASVEDCGCSGASSLQTPPPLGQEEILNNLKQIIDFPLQSNSKPPQFNTQSNSTSQLNSCSLVLSVLENFIPLDNKLKSVISLYGEDYINQYVPTSLLQSLQPLIPIVKSTVQMIKSKETNISTILASFQQNTNTQQAFSLLSRGFAFLPAFQNIFTSLKNQDFRTLAVNVQQLDLSILQQFGFSQAPKIESFKNQICQVIQNSQNPELIAKISNLLDSLKHQDVLGAIQHGIQLKDAFTLKDQEGGGDVIIPQSVLNTCEKNISFAKQIKEFVETGVDLVEITDQVDNFWNVDVTLKSIVDKIRQSNFNYKIEMISMLKTFYGLFNVGVILVTNTLVFKNLFKQQNFDLQSTLNQLMLNNIINKDVVLNIQNINPQIFSSKFLTISTFLFIKNYTKNKLSMGVNNIEQVKQRSFQQSISSTLLYLFNIGNLTFQTSGAPNETLLNQYKTLIFNQISQNQYYYTLSNQLQIQQILSPIKSMLYKAIDTPFEDILKQSFVQDLFGQLDATVNKIIQ